MRQDRNLRQAGTTLTEIMIALVIVGIAISLGVPSFNAWLQNSQIRTAGESLLGGVQLARGQAVAMNSRVCFQFEDSAGAAASTGTSWAVLGPLGALAAGDDCTTNAQPLIQKKSAAEGTRNVQSAAALSGTAVTPSFIVFNGLGAVVAPPQPWTLLTVNLSNSAAACSSSGGPLRCLRLEVSSNGQTRLCDPDPSVAAGDPRRC